MIYVCSTFQQLIRAYFVVCELMFLNVLLYVMHAMKKLVFRKILRHVKIKGVSGHVSRWQSCAELPFQEHFN